MTRKSEADALSAPTDNGSHDEGSQDAHDVLHHYLVEKELAARLRLATKEERKRLYGEIYDERIRRIPSHPLATRAASPRAQWSAVTRQLRLLSPYLTAATDFLEIGPGDCALAIAVAGHVNRVYAVDVSRSLCPPIVPPPNYTFIISEGVSVPVPAGSVDVAYSNQVLEHLHADDAVEHLSEVRKALGRDGRFICITPNRLSGPWDVSRRFDPLPTGLHLREYTTCELTGVLREAGFARVAFFLSFRGYRLSPLMSTSSVSTLERALEPVPHRLRQSLGHLLAAVKIVATKS